MSRDVPSIIDHNGVERLLGCLPPRADFGRFPKFRSRSGATPVIPRSDWKPIDRRALFPAASWILNQAQISSCVGNGAAAGLRKDRLVSGQTDVPLSPGCLYAQINNGQDQGAIISDALTALQERGTCSYATVGEEPYYLQQLPAGWQTEAQRFKVYQAYHCQTFDEIASAIQLGFIIVYGIMVGRNFESFDASGVAGYSRGPGNHCMHADGMIMLPDGRWVLDNANSWGPTWGPFGNGRCYLSEDHFLHGDQPDAFAIESAITDPQDPHEPPALKS